MRASEDTSICACGCARACDKGDNVDPIEGNEGAEPEGLRGSERGGG